MKNSDGRRGNKNRNNTKIYDSAEGADADLTIFDPKIIIDGANYTDINILPKGISYVIQKGRVAAKDNCVVNEKLGEFISFAG